MVTTQYHQTDSQELFEYNLAKQGPQWRWAKEPIEYQFNSRGWRMNKELDDVDYDNSILFLGCSYTLGMGLPQYETFAHKISTTLNLDPINAAVGGSSPEYCHHIGVELLSSIRPPKAVVVNWPALHRALYWRDNGEMIHCQPRLLNKVPSEFREGFISHYMNDRNMLEKFTTMRRSLALICRSIGSPLFEFTQINTLVQRATELPVLLGTDTQLDDEQLWARDIQKGGQWVAHLGPYHHHLVTNACTDWYKKL